LKPLYLANKNVAPLVEGWYHDFGKEGYVDSRYDAPFYPRFWPERLKEPYLVKKPRGIFTVDMGELFGDWIPQEWQDNIFHVIQKNPQHRFYLLTKQGRNLYRWSPFPSNCWVGITATGYLAFNRALDDLHAIDAKVKYLSIEPLLERVNFYPERLTYCGVKWVITGACTGTLEDIKKLLMLYPQLTPMPYGKKWTAQPKIEWVEEIVRACDKAGVKVFLKDNLKPLLISDARWGKGGYLKLLRQEMPIE